MNLEHCVQLVFSRLYPYGTVVQRRAKWISGVKVRRNTAGGVDDLDRVLSMRNSKWSTIKLLLWNAPVDEMRRVIKICERNNVILVSNVDISEMYDRAIVITPAGLKGHLNEFMASVELCMGCNK